MNGFEDNDSDELRAYMESLERLQQSAYGAIELLREIQDRLRVEQPDPKDLDWVRAAMAEIQDEANQIGNPS